MIYILEAESKRVPGRILRAYWERKDAVLARAALKEEFGEELEYAEIYELELLGGNDAP